MEQKKQLSTCIFNRWIPLVITALLLFGFEIHPKDYWKILESVKLSSAVMEGSERLYLKPTFSAKIKRLEGKLIHLEGYLTYQEQHYILTPYLSSKGHYSSLGPGPEETVGVELIGDFSKKTQYVVIEGYLKLNQSNPSLPFFRLEKAHCERCSIEKVKNVTN